MAPKGFQGTSLLDYPGKIASLIFYGGCNLSCPYCHNPGLVNAPDQYPDIELSNLINELKERSSFIDGVVVSGGEPTLAPDLESLLGKIKDLGLEVKLDTNGLVPEKLRELVEKGLIDFVALDLKTQPCRYDELHHVPVNIPALEKTIDLLLEGGVDYEMRTTCVPGLVELEDIHAMGNQIQGAQTWVLQQFLPAHAMQDKMRQITPHNGSTLQQMANAAEGYVHDLELRGF